VGVVVAKQQKRPKQLKQHQHQHSHYNQVKEHQPKKEEKQDEFVALLNETNKIIQENKQYLSRYHKKKLVKFKK
jgi:hypothetical protein